MAKKRRSILDADPSEIQNAGKKIMQQSPTPTPKEEKPPVRAAIKKPAVKTKSKRKMAYLDEDAHREVKTQASSRGMTIQEHLTSLIYDYKERNS